MNRNSYIFAIKKYKQETKYVKSLGRLRALSSTVKSCKSEFSSKI